MHTGTYKTGCRCPGCRRVHAVEVRVWRRRSAEHGPLLMPAVGVTRRLQALAVLGFGAVEIAARTGLPRPSLASDVLGRYSTCTVAKRNAVSAAYVVLQDLTPSSVAAVRTARQAARRGWLPPIAWDDDTIDDPAAVPFAGEPVDVDEVAVHRAVAGLRPAALSRSERRVVVSVLTTAGLSAEQIAVRVASTSRTVVRDRALAGEVA